jgi:LCP family protein required for cell wall assembly
MIVSLNQTTGKIKMASIMRDTYVNIPGKGLDKINAAFAVGGPQLAIKTINQNFDLDVRDYINVDFESAAQIINALGGVELNVKADEIRHLNNYLDEIAIYDHISPIYVQLAGLQNLNGKQTVAYSRIRYVGNGDYDRTERQRNVLLTLFQKMKTGGQTMIPTFTNTILPNIETSMSNMTLLNFAGSIFYSNSKTIEQGRFPLDVEGQGKRINNIWYLVTDLKATSVSLRSFLYK